MTRAAQATSAEGARRVLVTGGTGTLGRHVVAVLGDTAGITARVLSRRELPAATPAGCEWVAGDLAMNPLHDAVEGVDAIIHLASDKGAGNTDVIGTDRLLAAAEKAGVRHFVVISIIGCDRIPLPFYASKVRIEELTRASQVPWSIVRVAQFHSFVERLVATPALLPIPTPIIADLRFQPVDEREVAERLVEIATGDPLGDAPEIAGPELLTLAQIAAAWLGQASRPGSLVPVPLDAIPRVSRGGPVGEPWVSGVLEGYRAAVNAPRGDRTLGRVRFSDWLRQGRGAS